MINLRTKIPGPFATALKFGLLNLAAILFVFLFGAVFAGKLSSSTVDFVFEGVFLILTFPANLFDYSYATGAGGGSINFFFLNPLVWGAVAYVIHSFKTVQVVPNDTASPTRESTENKKFNGPPA